MPSMGREVRKEVETMSPARGVMLKGVMTETARKTRTMARRTASRPSSGQQFRREATRRLTLLKRS